MKKYNLSKIMKRAWRLVKEAGMTISSALKKAWKEAKNMLNELKNVVVAHFESYNARRYSRPWICTMTDSGKHDFSQRIGIFTGEDGQDGDLVVFDPVIGQVYCWGQKDYRGNRTEKKFCKWNGKAFITCDRLGNEE